jgi:hypothetical protein
VGIGSISPTSSFILETSGTIGPYASGAFDLGASDRTWRNVYADSFVGTSSWANNSVSSISSSYASSSTSASNSDTLDGLHSSSFQATLVIGTLYPITSSWSNNSIFALSALSSSYASSSLSSSYILPGNIANTYSASVSTLIGTKQNTLVTGTLYPITSSWSNNSVSNISSSYASSSTSASNADTLDGLHSSSFQATLVTGGTYNITSSWTNNILPGNIANSYSASVSTLIGTKQNTLTNTTYTITASFASNADKLDGLDSSSFQATLITHSLYDISASYAPIEPFSSASIVSQLGTKQPNLITGNTYTITSSWANNAISSSYASSSTSASYILSTGSGDIINSDYYIFGTKLFNISSLTYNTGLSISLLTSQSVYIKTSIAGWWPNTGSIGYSSEFFIQSDGVNQNRPGCIINQNNNNGYGGVISSIITDPGAGSPATYVIGFKSDTGTGATAISNSVLVYEVRGIFQSVT